MMHRLSTLVLAVAAACGSPLAAQSYAETAASLANAIRAGDTESQRASLPPLSEVEFAELGRLAGCDGALGQGGGETFLIIDWRCDQTTAYPGLTRSTTMFFDDEGGLIGFSINRLLSNMPIPARVSGERAILREFGDAVTDGGDPTLGGRVALDEFDTARLAAFAGGKYRLSRQRTASGQYRIFFQPADPASGRSRAALLGFDEAGEPSGVIFAPLYFASNRRSDARTPLEDGGNGDTRPVATGCVFC